MRSVVSPKDIERLCHTGCKTDLWRAKVALWRGDITCLKFDAIVNAANKSLLGGGGVDGAIHAAAGKRLLEECKTLGGCDTGKAKITEGYSLPSKHVIHTVGPIGANGKMLSHCYKNCLNLLLQNNLKTIAFPCISTGIYGYPNEEAAHVALRTTRKWLKKNHSQIDLIVFCLFLNVDVDIYRKLAEEYFPSESENKAPNLSGCRVEKREQEVYTGDDEGCISSSNNAVTRKNDQDVSDDSDEYHTPPMSVDLTEGIASLKTGDMVFGNSEYGGDNMGAVCCRNVPGDENFSEEEFGASSKKENKKDDVQETKKSKELLEAMSKISDVTRKETPDKSGLTPKERAEWIEKFETNAVAVLHKVICADTEDWAIADKDFSQLKLIGGLDISYHISRPDVACVSLVVLSFPELEVVYEDSTIETVSVPYISGYLAYREAEHYKKKIQTVRETKFVPQIILVDGNGILHPKKFGCAVQVGIASDIPTIGVAKNLLTITEFDIDRDQRHLTQIESMKERGGSFDIVTHNDIVLGKAVRTSDESRKPVYVSIGHRCSLETAVGVAIACSKVRVPEPIRQADHRSKLKIQATYKEDYDSYRANKANH